MMTRGKKILERMRLHRKEFRYLLTFAFCWACVFIIPLIAQAADYNPEANAGSLPRFQSACTKTLKYQFTDGLSSLLTAVAGIGAIISAAMGGFRMAWSLLVVALGSYLLWDFVNRFFSGKCPNG